MWQFNNFHWLHFNWRKLLSVLWHLKCFHLFVFNFFNASTAFSSLTNWSLESFQCLHTNWHFTYFQCFLVNWHFDCFHLNTSSESSKSVGYYTSTDISIAQCLHFNYFQCLCHALGTMMTVQSHVCVMLCCVSGDGVDPWRRSHNGCGISVWWRSISCLWKHSDGYYSVSPWHSGISEVRRMFITFLSQVSNTEMNWKHPQYHSDHFF